MSTVTDDLTSLDVVAPVQVKEMVYRRLRDALIDHDFAPGESLREVALSARFGVSKTPIREALVRLDHDGLVEIVPYRGARARVYTADDARELYEVRQILQSECVRLVVADPGEALPQLRLDVDRASAALAAGDLVAAAARLDAFDEVLLAVLDNRLLGEVVERTSVHLRRLGKIGAGAQRFEESVAQHRAVIEALEARDSVAAIEMLRAHLTSVLEAQIAAIEAGG